MWVRQEIKPKDWFIRCFFRKSDIADYYWYTNKTLNTMLYWRKDIITMFEKVKTKAKKWYSRKRVYVHKSELLQHLHYYWIIDLNSNKKRWQKVETDFLEIMHCWNKPTKTKFEAEVLPIICQRLDKLPKTMKKLHSDSEKLNVISEVSQQKLQEKLEKQRCFLERCLWKWQQNWKRLWLTLNMELVNLRNEKYSTTTTSTTSTALEMKHEITQKLENISTNTSDK